MRPRHLGPAATAALVLALALALFAGACAGGDGAARGTAAPRRTSTTTTAPGGCDDLASSGPWAVGRQQFTLVDPTRPTAADPARGLAAATSRTLPVAVLYPAPGDPGAAGTLTDGADAAPGRFPVVIYSHGVDSTGTERNEVLASWVRAGYVVVAPTYPLSSHPRGLVTDVVNQPADVMFVDAQLTDPASSLAPLAPHMAADCLALAGHSLGALTTVGATYDPCCRPKGQEAAIAIAGGKFTPTPGVDWSAVPAVPLLVVHGEKDARIPYAQGTALRAAVPGGAWLLRFADGQHSTMFDAPLAPVLDSVVVAFLDAELRGQPATLDGLPATLAGRTDAVLEAPAAG